MPAGRGAVARPGFCVLGVGGGGEAKFAKVRWLP